ncbi:PepSY-associated TM helix domain-containing protein [Anditalea andensis]|uniref:Iron transporter n=1 Tax=Anditalea andensis TaxID=1048983 RepID=A0A074L4F7_9BACT|nr:PepSY-associated TM helix domain-containing protein [Anditalea andensis]KEO75375.1 iron transporter [Anditalea andensis]
MAKTKHPSTWAKVRKFFNDIHLWTGLISGLVIIAVCLSGTIYVYNSEIREWSNRELHSVNDPGTSRKAADELYNIIKDADLGTVTSISIPTDLNRSVQVNVRAEGDKSRFGTSYYLNPYSGEILGNSKEATRTDEFMGYMFSLHRWLLLDRIEEPLIGELPNRQLGSYISGTATILFTIGVLTGLVIWFPQKLKTWRQGLKVKWNANWKRLNYDLHNTFAFYSLIFLLIMGATGPFWSFPWYRDGWQKLWGTYQEAPANPGPRGGGPGPRGGGPGSMAAGEAPADVPLLPLDTYIAAAETVLPYKGDYRIGIPNQPNGKVTINKNRTGFFAPSAGDRVDLDIATAAVQELDIFREKPVNERISRSIKALHVGDVYGQFTKLLYFFACLIATSLPITGTLIWINKMKKKDKNKKGTKKRNKVAV